MSGAREVGRYNLHRLGWSAFEDLSMQIMRVVLGEACSRFTAGADGGRDGWFEGAPQGKLLYQNKLSGAYVVQCKHTSQQRHPLTAGDLAKEVEKVGRLAAKKSCSYILITNRHVSAPAEAAIRQAFEALKGVKKCLVLAEAWIEDTIDSEPRLLRLVPRLYGIGDLAQILSYAIEKQSLALLEEFAGTLRTFVPTDSYRRAEVAFQTHRFVVLVGPPASGKSSIAANLCMVSKAQDQAVRVMRIEEAEQFKATWSPDDRDTLYWVDDVFGETTLDDVRLRNWSAAIEKVEAARKRGARIIFCTRDYILAAARGKLRRSKVDIIDDARVRVNVTELTLAEREAILYNHIKHGDLPRGTKRDLRIYLPGVARFPSFTPELARRLGTRRFTGGLTLHGQPLQDFFDKPVDHLREVLQGIVDPENWTTR